MAERRMLSKSLLMDNAFLSLSNDSKALYIYLLIFADDDGFVKRSVMIDGVLHVNDQQYSELEKQGMIISETNEIKIIVHWNSLETIREKLYTPTVYLNFRSKLYLKTDFSYTKDEKDKQVFSSVDDWVKSGRPKNIKDFEPLIQQHLKEVQSKYGTNTVQVQSKYGTCTSPDKNRLDKSSIDKTSIDKSSTGQHRSYKATSAYMLQTTSNEGMGEGSSSSTTTNSTKHNNATRKAEYPVNASVKGPSYQDSNKQSMNQSNPLDNDHDDKDSDQDSNQVEVERLIAKINQVFNTTLDNSNNNLSYMLYGYLKRHSLNTMTKAIPLAKKNAAQNGLKDFNNQTCLIAIREEIPKVLKQLN